MNFFVIDVSLPALAGGYGSIGYMKSGLALTTLGAQAALPRLLFR